MGNCFSACVKRSNSTSSMARKTSKRKKHGSGISESLFDAKLSQQNSRTVLSVDQLSVTSLTSFNTEEIASCSSKEREPSIDLSVIGRALPIHEKPDRRKLERAVSGRRVIEVQPCATNENVSDDTFAGGSIKRPITGGESNAFPEDGTITSISQFGSQSESSLEMEELSDDEDPYSVLPQQRVSPDPPVQQNNEFQLLDLLRIRLDMASNNMEMNRLLASVDRSLDTSARIREEAERRWRLARIRAYASSREEQAEEVECEVNNDEGRLTPPPPRPRICWQ